MSEVLPVVEGLFVRRNVLETSVCVCTFDSASDAILDWANQDGTYTTCHVNSHTVVNGCQDHAHQVAMNSCDLVTPDGSPVVKALQQLGETQEGRVHGPELMEVVCRKAAERGTPIGLYGGKMETLDALEASLKSRYPGIKIPYKYSPPFRPLTEEEIAQEDEIQRTSEAKVFFIGLGCPKQELYVYGKKKRHVPGVYMAVGAAIDINSGLQKKCPQWMQDHGFEWLFRLFQNPKRLWKRYAKYPIMFLWMNRKYRAKA